MKGNSKSIDEVTGELAEKILSQPILTDAVLKGIFLELHAIRAVLSEMITYVSHPLVSTEEREDSGILPEDDVQITDDVQVPDLDDVKEH